LRCSGGGIAGGSSTETVGIMAKVLDTQGRPVADALVEAYLDGDSDAAAIALSDDTGGVAIENIPTGTYRIEGSYRRNELVFLVTGVSFSYPSADSHLNIGVIIMKAPGSIRGQATAGPGDNSGTMAYIPGTSYLAITDSAGRFTITGIAEGTYPVSVARPGYTAVSVPGVVVISGSVTPLDPIALERDPALPPPAPQSLAAVYDTASGVVTLGWPPVDAPDLAGYIVYRLDNGTPAAITGVIVATAYRDTVFTAAAADTAPQLSYQVKAVDQTSDQSLFSPLLTVNAPPHRPPSGPFQRPGRSATTEPYWRAPPRGRCSPGARRIT